MWLDSLFGRCNSCFALCMLFLSNLGSDLFYGFGLDLTDFYGRVCASRTVWLRLLVFLTYLVYLCVLALLTCTVGEWRRGF